MTKIIGITGGIASGKSTLSKVLSNKGFKVHDSDFQVKKIYEQPTKKFLEYLKKIGLSKAVKENAINKNYISAIIFSNPIIKKKLEEFIFQIVRKERQKFITLEKKRKTKYIFIDVPLLFENNLDHIFDLIICVLSRKQIRYQRLKKNKKISETKFKKIISAQTIDKIRKKRSDILINNNQSMEKYLKHINHLIKKRFK